MHTQEIKAFSIQQFCNVHNISRAKFYLLTRENKAPRLMRVGRRRLISIEAAAEWRRAMEVDSEASQKISEKLSTVVAPHASVSDSLKRSQDSTSKHLNQ